MTTAVVRIKLNPDYPSFAAKLNQGVSLHSLSYVLGRSLAGDPPLPRSRPRPHLRQTVPQNNALITYGNSPVEFDVGMWANAPQPFLDRLAEAMRDGNGPFKVFWEQTGNLEWTPDPGALTPLVYPEVEMSANDLVTRQSPWMVRTKSDTGDDPLPTSVDDTSQVAVGFYMSVFSRALVRVQYLDVNGDVVADGAGSFTAYYKASESGVDWWPAFPASPPQSCNQGVIIEIPDTLRKELFIQMSSMSGTGLDHVEIQVRGLPASGFIA